MNDKMPVISLANDDANLLAQQLGDSFRTYGFAMVTDHGLSDDMVKTAWDMTEELFAQEEAMKKRGYNANIAGARGYTPFKTEIAKGADHHDLKEFWHVGRTLPENSPLKSSMPDNIWPERPEGFADHFTKLYDEFDQIGAKILSHIALYLGLDKSWFDPAIEDGNSVLRLLHYPPIEGDTAGAIRAGAHEDINLITLLLGAEEAGLEIKRPDGSWMAVSPPAGGLAVNVGDMLQRLTNHVLPSTTHRVVNPANERSGHSRYSMPYFLHLRSDFPIKTLDGCVSADNPNRYPQPILADDYLRERLIEIGLLKA
ncbi:flavonol synthase [Sphingorhabdus lutea]|uniref:2-oxoglutarate-dependent ethylene/succinate-forming enzyme n=1 Tax=Sphingorhabdus lutea TaxID=1913578 RepID=A0A1L3J9U6_9SPHN|nr:2-oxoglutarate and iron-dependent oxygenase domain-containing protein [Sphingorhabdus lutea]APG61907.1 flavonol synthase [Sphingorhabdus lutea]